MQALRALEHEHALIARALAIVELLGGILEEGSSLDNEVMVLLLEFCQSYGDSFHQRKEEFLLLPWLRNCGVDFLINPMVRLRKDHARTRELLRVLSEESVGRPVISGRLISALGELVVHLREQIHFEEKVIFQAAEELEGASAVLDEAFHEIGDSTEGIEERGLEIVEILERRFASLDDDSD